MLTLQQLQAKATQIKVIVSDVDGVLTDGCIFIRDDYEEPFGKFNILDGFAIEIARECGVHIAIISGRKSTATEARCKKLGIDLTFTGVRDKRAKLQEIATLLQIKMSAIAFIGDDLIDLPALLLSGLTCAPANAVAEVKSRVDYVSSKTGGMGVLREVVDLVTKANGSYDSFLARYLI
jgi:3-deoxy-D-manno-octulosonate 8-phosphate phosphatase (KDO 8-P phosphatase)